MESQILRRVDWPGRLTSGAYWSDLKNREKGVVFDAPGIRPRALLLVERTVVPLGQIRVGDNFCDALNLKQKRLRGFARVPLLRNGGGRNSSLMVSWASWS